MGTYALLALLALLFVPGCQTTGTSGISGESESGQGAPSNDARQNEEKRVSWRFYTPIWDQGDHLKRVVGEGGIRRAARLYLEQREFFADPKYRKANRVTLDHLAERLNDLSVPDLAVAIERLEGTAWPAPPGQWTAIKDSIAEARKARDAYPKDGLLADPEYRSPRTGELDNAISELKRRIEEDATTEFTAFDPFGCEPAWNIDPLAGVIGVQY
jgi:hypothetical protein